MTYRYHLPMRPPSIGTHPKGAVQVFTFDKRETLDDGRKSWGWVEYDHKLTDKEVSDYELYESEA